MTLKEFVKYEIPKRCGVHPAFGVVSEMIYNEELLGNDAFDQKNFKTVRDRAKLALPFKPVNVKEYERCLDIIEIILLRHANVFHNEENEKEIQILKDKVKLTIEEAELVSREWWNG